MDIVLTATMMLAILQLSASGEAHNLSVQQQEFTDWVHQVQSRARLRGSNLVAAPEIEFEGNVTFVVDQQGHGDFVTVQAAIDAVVASVFGRVTIHIRAGIYR